MNTPLPIELLQQKLNELEKERWDCLEKKESNKISELTLKISSYNFAITILKHYTNDI